MGVLGVDKLKRYAYLMGEDLPITEKIAMDLLLRTAEGDKEAQKIYWDLQKSDEKPENTTTKRDEREAKRNTRKQNESHRSRGA